MSTFDKLAGISEGVTLTRRSLKTLDEAGGGAKSSTAATTDHGSTPPTTKLGTPNSAYRPMTKPKIGGAIEFPVKARQLRTGKTASPRQAVPVRKE